MTKEKTEERLTNNCPAFRYEGGENRCFLGTSCNHAKREDCTVYLTRILPMRKSPPQEENYSTQTNHKT